MDWKKERDALIAQTMNFVQSVASRTEVTANRRGEIPSRQPAMSPAPLQRQEARFNPVPTEKPRAVEPAGAARPEPLAPLSLPSLQKDMKLEIEDRIASFRAHQERFKRERAEYFDATLAKLRAVIDGGQVTPRNGE